LKKINIFLPLLALVFTALTLAQPASASNWKLSVDDRADALSQQLKGVHNYHAYLALQLADKALDESSQHDLRVAQQFIQMAEEEAAKVRNSK